MTEIRRRTSLDILVLIRKGTFLFERLQEGGIVEGSYAPTSLGALFLHIGANS